MDIVIGAIRFALFLFMMLLFARMILGFVMVFSRDWRPTGIAVVLAESVFTVTDPPIKALRKVVPPLALGQVRLDMAFLIVFITCSMLYRALAVVG